MKGEKTIFQSIHSFNITIKLSILLKNNNKTLLFLYIIKFYMQKQSTSIFNISSA